MKKNIICILLIALIFTLFGCEKVTQLPDTPSRENNSSGDVYPPEDYKISDEDQEDVDLLKEIGLRDDDVLLVIYHLKKNNCGKLTKIEMDSSDNYYNIYDDDDNLFKLYVTGKKYVDALLDKDGNTIFAFIY